MPTTHLAAAMMAPVTSVRDDPDVAGLARAHGRSVFTAAYRILGDAAAAEDVQQEVFLRLISRRPTAIDSWPAYLCAAAARLAIDRLRRERRWQRLRPLWLGGAATDAPSAEHVSMDHEQAAQLRTALAGLNRKQAQCFALRCFEGLELGVIATQLGITENDVSVTLHRAGRALRTALNVEPTRTGEPS